MTSFHILYADVNSFIASQVKMRLEWKGYQVTTIDNEQELISNLHNQSYDLLIVDLLTPKPNAFSLLEGFKKHNTILPTIIVSNKVDKECHLVTKAMQLGCIDFVVKNTIIQKYIDRINLVIFQTLEKKNQHKTKTPKHQKISTDFNEKQPSTKTTNWEYIPSKDQVKWPLANNSTINTLSYDEFTAKIHAEDLAHVKTQNNICLFSQQSVNYNFRYLSDNNHVTQFHAHISAETNSNNAVYSLYGHIQEIYSQQATDLNLQLKLSFLENTSNAVFITDSKKCITSVNDAFINITGYTKAEILNKKVNILNTEHFDTNFFNKISAELKYNYFWQGEVIIRHKRGHTFPVWQSISILKNTTGHIAQCISVLRDISQQKAYEESIKFQANYDNLTQLPNRSLFLDRLNNALKQTKRNNRKLALMLIDLDRFKWINDKMGHHAGDILLQGTAKKLQAAIRTSDTVARLGGDEFSIFAPDLENAVDAEMIVRKIFAEFKKPIIIDQQEVFIYSSVGITIFPDDGSEIDTLQKNADNAMYMAKNKGQNSYYFFTQAIQQETEDRLQLINKIRAALVNHEFSLHYQPVMDIKTNTIASAETLLRWNQPQFGFMPLSDFIPTAEISGLIREIGNWVITEVADNMTRWSSLGFPQLQISLNQSVAQYSLSECHLEWLEILKNKQVEPQSITFEISEKIFLEEKKSYLQSIEKLKQKGIQISLDSFGTGYSSLNLLTKIPIDVVKIDRSYIQSMTNDPTIAVLVETIIMLANKLGIKVIATGVENKEQLLLLNNKCRFIQGYYFSKPLPLHEFESYIKSHNLN